MTVVNPKSISGITSITTPSSDDMLTIHNNNGSERIRIQSDKVMFSVDAKVDSDGTRDLGADGAKWGDAYITTLRATTGIVTSFTTIGIDDKIVHAGDTNTSIRFPSADTITAETGGSERIRLDSSGRLIVGHNANISSQLLQVMSSTSSGSISIGRWSNNADSGYLDFYKSRNASVGSNTIVQSGDTLGSITFYGDDASGSRSLSAEIKTIVDATPGTNDMPGRIVFTTSSDGSDTPTERVRIDSGGATKFWGTRAGSLQASESDNLQLYTKSSNADGDRGSGITFYNHDNSGYEMGGTIQVAKENDTADNTSSYMRLATRTNGSDVAERLRIDSNGYVGIKVANPHSYYAKDLVIGCIDQGGITLKAAANTNTQYLMFADGTSGNEAYRGYIGYQHNTGANNGEHLQLAASGTMVMRVDSDGLKFGTDTAAANALDDYEEGTFNLSPNLININYTTQAFTYTKIGNVVYISGRLAYSGASGTSDQLLGLPFAPSEINIISNFYVSSGLSIGSEDFFSAYSSTSGARLQMTTQSTETAYNMPGAADFYISGWYKTAS